MCNRIKKIKKIFNIISNPPSAHPARANQTKSIIMKKT